jgi:hypothetical protein
MVYVGDPVIYGIPPDEGVIFELYFCYAGSLLLLLIVLSLESPWFESLYVVLGCTLEV